MTQTNIRNTNILFACCFFTAFINTSVSFVLLAILVLQEIMFSLLLLGVYVLELLLCDSIAFLSTMLKLMHMLSLL